MEDLVPITDQIHIDEKWFYTAKTFSAYYLIDGEQEWYRTCTSKASIKK